MRNSIFFFFNMASFHETWIVLSHKNECLVLKLMMMNWLLFSKIYFHCGECLYGFLKVTSILENVSWFSKIYFHSGECFYGFLKFTSILENVSMNL